MRANFRYPERSLAWPAELDYELDVCGIAEEEAGPFVPGKVPGPALVAYRCPAGVWTIGYGETMGGSVAEGMTATYAEIDAWFLTSLAKRVAAVRKLCTHPGTNTSHIAAFVWFTYNVGVGAFSTSNVLKLHNAGRFDAVPSALLQWNKARDPKTKQLRPLPGLTKRRATEGARYLRPPPFMPQEPTPQAVAPEKPLAASPTMATTSLAGVATALEMVSRTEATTPAPAGPTPQPAAPSAPSSEILEMVRGGLGAVKTGLSELTGVPEAYVLPSLLLLALGIILYRRWNQRRNGLA